MKKEFVYSFNEEIFNSDHFDSIEECLEDARENADDEQVVFIGEVAEPNINLDDFGCDIIDDISEQLGEQVGEVAECFEPSRQERAILSTRIEAVVKEWLADIGGYGCFRVIDTASYELETGKFIGNDC